MDDGCRCEAIAKRERESESEMERWCRTDDLCSYWMYWCFLRGSPKSSKSLDNFRIESHGFGMFWGSPKLNFPYGHGSMIILDHPDAAGEIPVDGEELKRRCADSGVDAQTETIWEVLCGSRWGIFRGLTCLTWCAYIGWFNGLYMIIWILCRKSFANPQNGQMMAEISFSLQSGCCNYSTACLVESRRPLLSRKQLSLFFENISGT